MWPLILMGSLFIAISISNLTTNYFIRKNGTKLAAKVVSHTRIKRQRKYVYFPEIEYMIGNERHRARYPVSTPQPRYDDNSAVEILCHPNRPTRFVIEGNYTAERNAGWIALLGASLVFFAIFGALTAP